MINSFSHNLKAFQYAESLSPLIQNVCSPLFSKLGFTTFSYLKVMDDGRTLHLSTDEKWIKFYFEKEFYNDNDTFHKMRCLASQKESMFSLVSGERPFDDECCKALYDFNIWNIYSIYKTKENYVEVWAFATHKDNEKIINFYLNNTSMLNLFILYFSEKMFDFTTHASDCTLINTKRSLNELENGDSNVNDFIHEITPKKFPISVNGRKIVLSIKEIRNLHLLSRGHSIKESARFLGISSRTVEEYVNRLKYKLNVPNKNALIRVYLDNFDDREIKKFIKSSNILNNAKKV